MIPASRISSTTGNRLLDAAAVPPFLAGARRPLSSVRMNDDSVYVGNAGADAALDRGWILGHFKDAGDPRHSQDVEIKWGVHPRGDERAQWVRGEERTALLVLISGRFRVELPRRDVVLSRQGDYVVWGHGVDHSWFAEEESVVLTVRWPSVPGYAVLAAPDAGGGAASGVGVRAGDARGDDGGTASSDGGTASSHSHEPG